MGTWCWICKKWGTSSICKTRIGKTRICKTRSETAARPHCLLLLSSRGWRRRPAGGRNHVIHSRVDGHLSIVIEGVADGEIGDACARHVGHAGEGRLHQIELVGRGQGAHHFV